VSEQPESKTGLIVLLIMALFALVFIGGLQLARIFR
jgi:hypothetical protein